MNDFEFEATPELKSRRSRPAAERLHKTPDPVRGESSLLHLQRHYGNRYVQRVVALARQAAPDGEAAPEVESAIQRSRSGGQALDSGVRTKMEPAFNADFSGVQVHTDAEADRLNRAVNARAFTTGQNIFFRHGTYNPGSSSGQELIAHELTHVVQQTGGRLQPKLTISQPGDKYEQEADHVAHAVMQSDAHSPQPVAARPPLQRQEEEKESVQTKLDPTLLQRQPEEEKKEE
jgi:hypothetical protein